MSSSISDQDDAFDLLPRLQQARRSLSAMRERYGVFVYEKMDGTPGLILPLLVIGLACVGGALWALVGPFGVDRLRDVVAVSLLLVGAFSIGAAIVQRSRNESERVLRKKLKAELAIALDLDRDLESTEHQLSLALEDGASRSH